jgi:uncharacterized protein (TIGR03435 family)
MTRLALLLLGLALAALPLAAQQAAPAFEVASIKKQTAPIIPSGPPGAAPALSGMFRRGNATVVTLVRIAYNVTDAQIIGGPDWVRNDLFEVNARAASAISLDGMRPMVAALLAERFKLIVHREQKTMRGAVLVMAREDRRAGPKLARCEDPNAPRPPPTPVRVPRGGYPLSAWCQPIASLVAVASNIMRVPVMDRTGLDGLWSYLTFYAGSPEPNLPGDGDNALPFPAALSDELGLRLRDSNGPFDVVVIDSVEQPTPD